MAKTLCKLAKRENEQALERIATCEGTKGLRAICAKCGRLAAKKKLLCKAKSLQA